MKESQTWKGGRSSGEKTSQHWHSLSFWTLDDHHEDHYDDHYNYDGYGVKDLPRNFWNCFLQFWGETANLIWFFSSSILTGPQPQAHEHVCWDHILEMSACNSAILHVVPISFQALFGSFQGQKIASLEPSFEINSNYKAQELWLLFVTTGREERKGTAIGILFVTDMLSVIKVTFEKHIRQTYLVFSKR